jgi:hypothetical protein
MLQSFSGSECFAEGGVKQQNLTPLFPFVESITARLTWIIWPPSIMQYCKSSEIAQRVVMRLEGAAVVNE